MFLLGLLTDREILGKEAAVERLFLPAKERWPCEYVEIYAYEC